MFKDYYSILGISYPSNNEEICHAYHTKVENLGEASAKESNSNYAERVDVEEAFRVVGASYSLKAAYDEEYAQYLASEDKESFSIQNDWTISQISSERDFVINHILQNASINPSKNENKGIGGKVLGCFLKTLGFLFCLLIVAYAKTCARKHVHDALTDSYMETNYNQNNDETSYYQFNSIAESKLQKTTKEINQSLPMVINENITYYVISLTPTSLVYVFHVDDDYFQMTKKQALSTANQLSNIRARYSDMKPMIDLLVQTHRGISYKYICKKSKETNIVEVAYKDLASL